MFSEEEDEEEARRRRRRWRSEFFNLFHP